MPDDLTSVQREAVRLDFAGGSCRTVGDALGVSRTTVWKWRQLHAYRVALAELHEEANEQTLADARKTRGEALKVTRAALTRLGQRLARDPEGMSSQDLASTARAGLAVYQATAAQTGLPETTRSEVVTGPADQTRSLVDRLLADED